MRLLLVFIIFDSKKSPLFISIASRLCPIDEIDSNIVSLNFIAYLSYDAKSVIEQAFKKKITYKIVATLINYHLYQSGSLGNWPPGLLGLEYVVIARTLLSKIDDTVVDTPSPFRLVGSKETVTPSIISK